MNPVSTDTQQAKKNFAPNAGAANLARNEEHEQDQDREFESPRNEKRASNSSTAATPAKSNRTQNHGEQGAKVTSLRDNSAAPEGRSEEKQEKETSPAKKEQPQKEPTLVDNLDLALMNASISIGDWVKRIEALSPKEGGIARASQFTVSKLQAVQNYIGDNGTKEMAESAWNFVRRSPLPVGLAVVGAGVGFYLSRNATKASETKTSTQE